MKLVTYHPLDGHPLTLGWSPTRRKCTTDLEFGTYTLLSKLTPGDNCQGWSPTIPRMVTHQPKDGHPTEACMLQTRNLTLRLISQNYDKVTTARNGHLPSLEWSPTNPRMVTLHKEVYYRLEILHLDLTHKNKTSWQLPGRVTYHPGDGHPPTQAWSLKIRMHTTEFVPKT